MLSLQALSEPSFLALPRHIRCLSPEAAVQQRDTGEVGMVMGKAPRLAHLDELARLVASRHDDTGTSDVSFSSDTLSSSSSRRRQPLVPADGRPCPKQQGVQAHSSRHHDIAQQRREPTENHLRDQIRSTYNDRAPSKARSVDAEDEIDAAGEGKKPCWHGDLSLLFLYR